MIPILYYGGESSFTTNGIGRLSDIISCTVEEERNGIYECEFQYPVTGIHYSDIQLGRIISCTHDDNGDRQPFIIYQKSEPLNGIVTFNAHHISYRLNHVVVKPFTAANASLAISAIPSNLLTECNFTFWTDKATAAIFKITSPRSVRNLLGGQEGSFLDVYGGEYEFDKFTVKYHQARGSDNGATIRYGKNLTNYERTVSREGIYSAIIPYYHNAETDTSIYGSLVVATSVPTSDDIWTDQNGEPIVDDNGNIFNFTYQDIIPVAYDFSDQFDEQPTKAQLEAVAQTFLDANNPFLADENFVVDFVQLWQTEEYASYAPLQRVKLCDTVTVIIPDMGVSAAVKVIRTVYNCLLDRYDEIELGSPSKTYNEILMESTQAVVAAKVNNEAEKTYQAREDAIAAATTQLMTGLTGATGSYIVFTQNASGGFDEMFIMNTNNINTATKVWRYNSSGWGYSASGIGGPYTLAATQNGAIVADFITSGKLQGYNDNNYWDLTNGYLAAEEGNIGPFTFNYWQLEYEEPKESGSGNYGHVRINSSFMEYGEEYWSGEPLTHQTGTYATLEYDGIALRTFDALQPDYRQWRTWVLLTTTSDVINDGRGYNFRFLAYQTGNVFLGYQGSDNRVYSRSNWTIESDFEVASGYSKNKRYDTDDYSDRLLYSYETTSPLYGDLGEGEIGEDGRCYVWLDPVFAETIKADHYQVFLQAYGNGRCYVAERHPGYFVVEGTEGLAFGWELKARQGDLDSVRLNQRSLDYSVEAPGYGESAKYHLDEIKKERGLSA